MAGKLLENNSSETLLTNGAVFTGTAENVAHYTSITVMVYASHASATNGLSMEFSKDGSNWDQVATATVSATTTDVTVLHVCAEYFRCVYTNGITTQTAFRLSCLASDAPVPAALTL